MDLSHKVVSHIKLYMDNPGKNSPSYVYAKQYDTDSRYIVLNVYNTDGEMLSPSTTQLNAKKPDGTYAYISEQVHIEGSDIIIGLTSQLLAVPGVIECDALLQSHDAGYEITTPTFYIVVEEAIFNEDAIESRNELGIYNEIPELFDRIVTIESKIPEEATPQNQLADKEYVDTRKYIEVGTSGQHQPSADLLSGGLFFERR